MNRLWNILFIALFATSLSSCDDTADTNLDQRTDIIDYLESSHSPKLLYIDDAEESLDDDPAFYTIGGYTTFMYVETFYDTDRETLPQIKKGSTISITYTLYNFENITTPTTSDILTSNDAEQIALLEEAGLNATYWSSEPLFLRVGEGTIFSSIEDMLIGCYEGDVIEFYMTLNDAYGTAIIGSSTEGEPLAFFCTINEVI
ncbi:MAG: hypothetical protein SNG10_01470 [Rikenellaceae bacterium]